jgi:hypothetical protein
VKPYQQGLGPRTGWFWQSIWMNDGGEDAPMDEQSNRFFKHLTIGALVCDRHHHHHHHQRGTAL